MKALLQNRSRALIIFLILALLVGALLEYLIANRHALFSYDAADYPVLDPAPFYVGTALEDGVYTLTPRNGQASLAFSELPDGIYSISFEIAYSKTTAIDTLPAPSLQIQSTDTRTTWSNGGLVTIINGETFSVGRGEDFEKVTLHASVRKSTPGQLNLIFRNLSDTVQIRSLLLNEAPKTTFSLSRALLLSLLLYLPVLLKLTGVSRLRYDPHDSKQRIVLRATVIITVTFSLLFASSFLIKGEKIAYPLEKSVASYNPYVQQFDAFQKGQLHIDVTPSDTLLEIENPYDYNSRKPGDPLWDRAFYNGKYYSYFGIAPILTVYYPHYLLNGTLPSDSNVLTFFLLLSAIFIPLTVIRYAELHENRKLSFPLLFVGAVAAFFSSNLLLLARGYNYFYYIAVLAGNAFLSLFLYLLTRSAGSRGKARLAYLALAGTAYALLFLSRLNIALLAAFIVLPFLYFRILRKEDEGPQNREGWLSSLLSGFRPMREFLPSLLAIGIPVLLGFLFTFWFNDLRFDSILEFGTSYQFTVSDIRYNRVSILDLPAAIYHYFLQPLPLSGVFPYFTMRAENLANYGHFVYVDAGMGLLNLPLNLLLLLSPAAFFRKKTTKYEKSLLGFLLVGLLTVALLNFSLGGVIFRYTGDLTLLSALLSVFLIFSFCTEGVEEAPLPTQIPEGSKTPTEIPAAASADAPSDPISPSEPAIDRPGEQSPKTDTALKNRAREKAAILFLLFSILIAFLISLMYNGNLTKYESETFIAIRNFFEFKS